jgi:uncharacterized protein (DUF58 family)
MEIHNPFANASGANAVGSSASERGSRFFEPQRLSGFESMRFTTSRRVDGTYSGRHLAKQLGGAGEFADYREYTPGDDLRRLDWRVMGRMGRAYLKLFQDETDLSCTLLIDASQSMSQGALSTTKLQGSKLEWTQYFATALAHMILLGRDSVGLAVLKGSLDDYLPPSSAVQQRGLIHSKIASLQPKSDSRLDEGLDELMVRVKRRGALMILSDFLVPSIDRTMASIRKFRSRGWEIIALHLTHSDEEKLPDGNAFRFVGWEGEGTVNCQVNELRKEYIERFEQHMSTTRASLVSVGCDYHRISVSTPYLDVLRSFLVTRR